MESRASYGTGRRRSASPPTRPSPSTAPFGHEDFPGCEPFPLPESELERYEGRLEFWDGLTHTAWRVCEPTTLHHEGPTQMLAQVAERFAGLRGSRSKCFGSVDLARWEASGTRRWLMQADQVLYLHPGRSRPSGRYIDVDRDPLPDVVLEVDYSTDVRRRKLSIYEEGGFPEVWVLAPPGSRLGWHRLTIYALGSGGVYRSAPESGAIPGWKPGEIYDALVEEPWSEPTWQALERVALAMGTREGTRPEDDPLSRTLIRRGEARGRQEERAEMVRTVLLSRGIEASPRLEEELVLASDVPTVELLEAALGCANEAHLLRRVRERPDSSLPAMPRYPLRRRGGASDEETGRNSRAVYWRFFSSCAGWPCPPTPGEFYDAIREESPNRRQRTVLRAWFREATNSEVLRGWIEEAYTWPMLAAAIHRVGYRRNALNHYLNGFARRRTRAT